MVIISLLPSWTSYSTIFNLKLSSRHVSWGNFLLKRWHLIFTQWWMFCFIIFKWRFNKGIPYRLIAPLRFSVSFTSVDQYLVNSIQYSYIFSFSGTSVKSLCKPCLFCLVKWVASFRYSASGTYWSWRWSPCFAYCGMHILTLLLYYELWTYMHI